MEEFRKILVPVDFSEHSARALEHAKGLAKVFAAELHLLHCYPINVGAVLPYGIVIPESLEHDVRKAALERLAEWREKVSAEGIAVQEHITPQVPFEAIAATAEQLGADLIVMGTRGLTGLKHVLLGSVAERTLRIAPCPVLTVKDGDAD